MPSSASVPYTVYWVYHQVPLSLSEVSAPRCVAPKLHNVRTLASPLARFNQHLSTLFSQPLTINVNMAACSTPLLTSHSPFAYLLAARQCSLASMLLFPSLYFG